MNKEVSNKKSFLMRCQLPEYIFGFAVFLVFLSILIFYLVDLRNFLGARDVLFETSPVYFFFSYLPLFFQHWGRNSGFAEIMQWLLLGGSALIMSFCAGRVYNRYKNLFMFLCLMSLAFIFMILEDAGNIRHTLMSYAQAVFDEPDQGIMGTGVELIYFISLAALPLYALIRYGKVLRNFGKAKIYIIIGFLAYGLAASLSFIGTAFEGLLDRNVYTIAGEKLYSLSLYLGDEGLDDKWQMLQEEFFSFPIGFFLLDSLIEENIELIGAGAFLAAAVSIFISFRQHEVKVIEENKV